MLASATTPRVVEDVVGNTHGHRDHRGGRVVPAQEPITRQRAAARCTRDVDRVVPGSQCCGRSEVAPDPDELCVGGLAGPKRDHIVRHLCKCRCSRHHDPNRNRRGRRHRHRRSVANVVNIVPTHHATRYANRRARPSQRNAYRTRRERSRIGRVDCINGVLFDQGTVWNTTTTCGNEDASRGPGCRIGARAGNVMNAIRQDRRLSGAR